ncbi:amidohydrolase [Micromonospora provocatoris]|uniref:amidohydrolase n=1 Tax=Micromonospora provocatoris TaxID=322610 RepID=UPI003D270481
MSSTLNVAKEIEQVVPQILQWRRYLHENPELSYEEYATADFVYNQLISFGNLVVTRPTKTSVLAVLKGTLPGDCLAFRADMDALPIQEETDLPFASKVAGVMHACGHDGHTAMLLGAAKILSTLQQSLKGEIRFIFQHAEELFPGGAKEMVAAGVVDGVDRIIGLHLFSTLPTGKIGICAGPFTANSDTFDIEIIGKGGHSSQPHDSINPILIGSQITNVLHHIIPQKVNAEERAVLAVTEFHAGSAKNIIPDRLVIGGSVRTFSQQVRERIAQQIAMQVQHTVAAIGMFVGLAIAVFVSYRKPREYKQLEEDIKDYEQAKLENKKASLDTKGWIAIVAIFVALGIQLSLSSLVLGALSGIIIMFIGRVVFIKDSEEVVQNGVKLMGVIAFIMLIASGYATILKETNAITELVEAMTGMTGQSKLITAILLLFIGLLVTMGIGTSFGTIPILAVVFVPLCAAVGFSALATAALIGTAGALGDAGSPASDSTLGPTSGLNADGQHNHIWDTCVPTFLHYNIPLFIFGIIAAMVL